VSLCFWKKSLSSKPCGARNQSDRPALEGVAGFSGERCSSDGDLARAARLFDDAVGVDSLDDRALAALAAFAAARLRRKAALSQAESSARGSTWQAFQAAAVRRLVAALLSVIACGILVVRSPWKGTGCGCGRSRSLGERPPRSAAPTRGPFTPFGGRRKAISRWRSA